MKFKNAVLLLSSLVFYFYGEQLYVFLMIFETAISYVFGILIHKSRGRGMSRFFLVTSVFFGVGALVIFKYSDFFIESVNGAAGTSLGALGLALPLGISFYTFQTISYDVDVYRGDVLPERNFLSFATYVTMFPQLVAGPIVRYTNVENTLQKRAHSVEKFADGAFRFTVGLAKKVILADRLYELCEAFTWSENKSVAFCWIYAAAFSLYVYFDFSGYSDMAIGLGKIFGFDFPENFDHPFISKSAGEFWRRWHISLGAWFRDYVYVPMGGNRVSRRRWVFNIAVVWLLTGLWHGAAWNFVLWGLCFGVFIVLERLVFPRVMKKLPAAVLHLYLIVVVCVGFVIFGAESLSAAAKTVGSMFGAGGLPLWSGETTYYLSSYAVVLAAAVICSAPMPMAVKKLVTARGFAFFKPAFAAAVVVISTSYFADSSFSPFLYFRF